MTFHIDLPVTSLDGPQDIHRPDAEELSTAVKHALVVDYEASTRTIRAWGGG